MKLLILAQAVDLEDNAFSFFHRWIEELAPHFEQITVICLKEGKHAMPPNVHVCSLGKETGRSRLKYTMRFYRYIWSLRHDYDAVFVHMNEEYGILGGWLWRLMGKHVTMWRNYHKGTWRTDIAAFFCNKIFCTSVYSYTAKYKKTVLMPVGVDVKRFFPNEHIQRVPKSILFFSGMWPSKRPEMLIDALTILHERGIGFIASFYGSPLPEGAEYYQSLKQRVIDASLSNCVTFHPGVPNAMAPDIFRAHDIFVNCSPSGMFDKMLFEAAACGCRVLAVSDDFAKLAGSAAHFDSAQTLADRLSETLARAPQGTVPAYVGANSLTTLALRLADAIY